MQFSTKPYDEGTGLSYYDYRFYAPTIGRWMTRDPLGEGGGINLYGFVGNNPMNLVDPFGLAPGDCFPTMDETAKDMRSYVRNLKRSWGWGGWPGGV
jgi:RHS repeat-associated protein